MVTLIDLLSSTYAPVQTMILPYLEIADVVALTRTCKGFSQVQPTLKATVYNANHFLKRFFSDPVEFRSILGGCRALLSGRPVRHFLQRSQCVSLTIDIFVSQGQEFPLIAHLQHDGYVRQIEPQSIQTIFQFEKLDVTGQELRVQLHCDSEAALAQIFDRADMTSSMNLMSWNRVYALFPHTTFIKSECYLVNELGDGMVQVLTDMTTEGLKTKAVSWAQREATVDSTYNTGSLEFLPDKDADDIGELIRRRRVGDRHTWVLDLDTQGVRDPGIPSTVLESSTFRLRVPHRFYQRWDVSHYVIDYDPYIQHPVLRYQYVTLGEDTRESDDTVRRDRNDRRRRTSYYSRKCQELHERLDELTMIELTKIPIAKRPAQHRTLMASLTRAHQMRGKFALPATWTFYDDKVITYLDKAWKVQQMIDKQEETLRKAKFESWFDYRRAEQMLHEFRK